jgi:signal transduction histidine kinase
MVGRDITERKQLEAELLQVQKLDVIGRLTIAIAHDLNNLLTGIAGFAELGRGALPAEHAVQDDLEEIIKATSRAAALTSRLLTFAQKQAAAPHILDLNTLVLDMDKLLRRLIGAHITLITQPAPDPAWVFADSGQVEQVLVNLVVNARDAMLDGGVVTIAIANATADTLAGGYGADHPTGASVRLVVSDTGVGIDSATRARLFEPFFTTKAPERGNGLGLSTCYRIIKQHGGDIFISSETGCGTTVTISLPQMTVADAAVSAGPAIGATALPHSTETVLLVKDEEVVHAARAWLDRPGSDKQNRGACAD